MSEGFDLLFQNHGYKNPTRDASLKVSSFVCFQCMCFIASLPLLQIFLANILDMLQPITGITYI